VLSFVSSALCGFPVVIGGRQVYPSPRRCNGFHGGLTSAKRPQFQIDWLTSQARDVRGEITRRTMHASGTYTLSPLSQALLLAYLPSSHSAFQDHVAHIVEWSTMLRPNGSWGTYTSQGIIHSLHALHGALFEFPIRSMSPSTRSAEETCPQISSNPLAKGNHTPVTPRPDSCICTNR
jgi:hypothetical protein